MTAVSLQTARFLRGELLSAAERRGGIGENIENHLGTVAQKQALSTVYSIAFQT